MAAARLRDYYDVLEVPRRATTEEIRKQYKRLSLHWHPDKNLHNPEEALLKFKELQNAYSVLVDPNERQWYDEHRESILRGVRPTGDDAEEVDGVDLWPYFSPNIFTGFGDDDKGFYSVYQGAFDEIWEEEELWIDRDYDAPAGSRKGVRKPPTLGDSTTDWEDVSRFYDYWTSFSTKRPFGYKDKWNPNEAPDRRTKRMVEKENLSVRRKAKLEYTQLVKRLVLHVKKRDLRVLAYLKVRQEKEKIRREDLEEQRKNKAAKSRAEAAVLEEEYKERMARPGEDELEDEELVRAWIQEGGKKGKTKKKNVEQTSEEDSEVEEFYCQLCKKTFRSQPQFDQHNKTNKHVQALAKWRLTHPEESEEEEEEEEEDEEEEESSEEESSGDEDSPACKKSSVQDSEDDDDEEEEESEDEEAPPKKRVNNDGKKKSTPENGILSEESGGVENVIELDDDVEVVLVTKPTGTTINSEEEEEEEEEITTHLAKTKPTQQPKRPPSSEDATPPGGRRKGQQQQRQKNIVPTSDEESDEGDDMLYPTMRAPPQRRKNKKEKRQRWIPNSDDNEKESETPAAVSSGQSARSKKKQKKQQWEEKKRAEAEAKKREEEEMAALADAVPQGKGKRAKAKPKPAPGGPQREENRPKAAPTPAPAVEEKEVHVKGEMVENAAGEQEVKVECRMEVDAESPTEVEGEKKEVEEPEEEVLDWREYEDRKVQQRRAQLEGAKITCMVCATVFPSRSKLFVHIEETGHGAPKDMVQRVQKNQKRKR